MRKLGLKHSLTAQLYQAGWTREEARDEGANMRLWDELADRYNGSPIPAAQWLGSHHCESPTLAHTASGYSF